MPPAAERRGPAASAPTIPGTAAESGLLAAVRTLAADVLAPAAADCETEVPASHLRLLAGAGVFGISGPDVRPALARDVEEVLAAACGAAWFVQLQHHGTAAAVRHAHDEGRDVLRVGHRDWPAGELSAAMLAGEVLGGIALAHVRRPDRPMRAERVAGGWRLTGTVSWYTGWGLNDVMALAAVADDGSVVSALVPARASAELAAGEPIRPLAMGGTRTVALVVHGLTVTDSAVLSVVPAAEFALGDAQRAANTNPGVFGVCSAALTNLRTAGTAAEALAGELEARCTSLRREAWELVDDVPTSERLPERLAVRAAAGELAVRAATAEVVAAGGRGLMPGHPAQRHAREALFLLTQAQTGALRGAQLEVLRETVGRVSITGR